MKAKLLPKVPTDEYSQILKFWTTPLYMKVPEVINVRNNADDTGEMPRSLLMSAVQKTVTFEQENSANSNEVYVKTNALTDEQKGKGYYVSISEQGNIQGFYKGTRLSTGKYPGATEHLIESLDGSGKVMVLKQAGNLGARLKDKNVQVGDAVQITYKGKQPAKGGKYAGTAMHRFTVQTEADSSDNE